MNYSIKILFKPTFYVLAEDQKLKASIQKISEYKQKGSWKGRTQAVAQAVHGIVLALLVNTPYYFTLGSKNLFLNCVHLNLELMVLGYYKVAMQNLIYSIIATVYVSAAIFITSAALDGFKMQEHRFDDSSSDDFSVSTAQKSGIRSSIPSFKKKDLLNSLNRSFVSDNIENQTELKIEESSKMSSDFHSFDLVQNGIYNEYENRDFISSQQYASRENSMLMSTESDLESLSDSGDWSMLPNIELFALKSLHIRTYDLIGAYGVNLERQAYRIALNEYIRILREDFTIDPKQELIKIKNMLSRPDYQNDPIFHALYHTLFYLTNPVVYIDKKPLYAHAKEQYEKYVIALREVHIILTKEKEDLLRGSNLQEKQKCLALADALYQARFLPENHGLLRNLLQLHEDEYNRLNPGKEIPAITRENFARVVMAKNQRVQEAPASMKVSSTQKNSRMLQGAIGYEDFLMTDIPFLRGKQMFVNHKGEERSFYYMRHPTPHIQGSPMQIALGALSRTAGLGPIESGEVIAPEFEGMLEAIARRKESYLIQSHQRLNDSGRIENEDSRSQTLYRLQISHHNFHVVFQAVEGDLFDRKGSYEKMETFAQLKEAIKASFYKPGSPNRLPTYLEKDERYRNVIMDQLLNQVHQALFEERYAISFDGQDPTQPGVDYPNREWQAFILAFYILQGDDLKFRLPNVKYFCTNCKNFFDRGGNRAMAEDRLHQEMSKQEVTNQDLEATVVNLIPIPLQSKGKAVIEKRLKSGLALAEILVALPVEGRHRLQEIHFEGGYKPERFEVSEKKQRALPLIEDVSTLQEMKEVLKALQGKSYCIIDNSIIQNNQDPYQNNREGLFKQVNKDLQRCEVHIKGILYNAQGSNNSAREIFEYLKAYRDEDLALKVMAQIQQSIFLEPTRHLMEAFQHDTLGLNVTDSPEKSTIDVLITEEGINIQARNHLFYKTTDLESPYFCESPIAIFSTTVLVTISQDGSDSNAHWTWEVAVS